MIYKEIRSKDESDKFNIRVVDKNNNSFVMLVGGNFDLYWLPTNYNVANKFYFDKGDNFTYKLFNRLFELVKNNDDKFEPVLSGNIITFISEDYPSDEANQVKITRLENEIVVDFVRHDNESQWTIPHGRMGSVCFCNSGSRIPKVEQLFMQMFNYLAYNCDKIEMIKE